MHVQCSSFCVNEEKQHDNNLFCQIICTCFFFLICSDPEPGTDDQRANQVVADGVANADDMNLPGQDSCSFLYKKVSLCKNQLVFNF